MEKQENKNTAQVATQQPQVQVGGLKKFNDMIVNNPKTQDYLAMVLHEKKDSFVNNLTALVANNKALQVCEPMSLMYAAIKATALNLPLDQNLGFAYVIPFKNNKLQITEAQFQIGAKGFIQLGIRSGQFQRINTDDVREGEIVSEDFLSGDIVFKKLPNRDKLKVIGYFSYFRLNNGFEKTLYMTVEEITTHAKTFSETFKSKTDWIRNMSNWTTNFPAMAKKTVLKLNLSKYAPLSTEMQDAIRFDQAVIGDNGVKYIDNGADEPDVEYAEFDETPIPEIAENVEATSEEPKEVVKQELFK